MLVFSGWLDMVIFNYSNTLFYINIFNIILLIIKSWIDYSLKWNPADFGNITTISVMSDKIWIPGN